MIIVNPEQALVLRRKTTRYPDTERNSNTRKNTHTSERRAIVST